VQIGVAQNEVVLGGGAMVGEDGAGNLLTAIYPANAQLWEARSKDHGIEDPEWLVAACNTATVSHGDDYWLGRSKAQVGRHATAVCGVPCDFELVGGGAFANWEVGGGPGNLLWASVPIEDGAGRHVWFAAAKDHHWPGAARLTAYACGLRRSFLQGLGLEVRLFTHAAGAYAFPSYTLEIEDGDWRGAFVSGGATLDGHPLGSLLTSCYPYRAHHMAPLPEGTYSASVVPPADRGQRWYASGKDHVDPNASRITVTGVAIGCVRATVKSR
jgi:hypothetical protein